MEKRYLMVYKDGRMLGAFENITDFKQDENSITFTGDEGTFTYEKNKDGMYECGENFITFDDFKLRGARAVDRNLRNMGVNGRKDPHLSRSNDMSHITRHTVDDDDYVFHGSTDGGCTPFGGCGGSSYHWRGGCGGGGC